MRLKLTLAYDGRPFQGWQSQPGGDTVQDFLQDSASGIAGTPIAIHGAGRTDTGVHALGQCAHFDAPPENRMRPDQWLRALNANLPPAIRVLTCAETAPDFHSRFNATEKEYLYKIHLAEVLPPLLAGLVWHLPRPLDLDVLSHAARLFEGTHDFANFAANRGDEKTEGRTPESPRTIRTIHGIVFDQPAAEPGVLTLTYRGNGFLYRMVRLITGSIVRCALGKAELSWLESLLQEPPDPALKTSHCAPADGLYLVRVGYP